MLRSKITAKAKRAASLSLTLLLLLALTLPLTGCYRLHYYKFRIRQAFDNLSDIDLTFEPDDDDYENYTYPWEEDEDEDEDYSWDDTEDEDDDSWDDDDFWDDDDDDDDDEPEEPAKKPKDKSAFIASGTNARYSFYEERDRVPSQFFDLAIDYFADIAGTGGFASEHEGHLKRWEKEEIDLSCFGKPERADLQTLSRFVSQLNSIPYMPQISLDTDGDTNADIKMYFGDYDALCKMLAPASLSASSHGYVTYSWYGEPYLYEIYEGVIGIRTDNDSRDDRDEAILGCLCTVLGLTGATEDYPDSLFYFDPDHEIATPKPSEFDWALLEFLYRPELETPITVDRACDILRDLFLD